MFSCLSQGFYSYTNIRPRSKLSRKEFIQLTFPHCCSSPQEVRTGTQAGQKAGADAEAMEGFFFFFFFFFYWLASPGMLSLLSYRIKTTSPEMAPPTRGPPPLIEKMPYSWISWRHFLKGSSFLCDNSSLCQVDTQNQPVLRFSLSLLIL
jgi:hypothetical protein